MAVLKSSFYTTKEAAGNQFASGLTQLGAKVRLAFFDFVTTGGQQNDTVDLIDLPKGARLLGGKIITEALGTSVTLSVGLDGVASADTATITQPSGGSISESATMLLGATAAATAVQLDFANTYALGAGATLDVASKLYATIGGANPTTAKYVCGWVLYAQN